MYANCTIIKYWVKKFEKFDLGGDLVDNFGLKLPWMYRLTILMGW